MTDQQIDDVLDLCFVTLCTVAALAWVVGLGYTLRWVLMPR